MRSDRHAWLAAAVAGAVAYAALASAAWGAIGARSWRLQADSLVVNSAAQTIQARGHVHLSDGRVVLSAALAVYYVKLRRIVLTGEVTATTPDGVLRSREATLFLDRTNAIERLAAQGTVTAKTGSDLLAADRAVYVPATSTVTASGHVRVTTRSGTATGGTLEADLRRKTGTLFTARLVTAKGIIAGDRLDVEGSIRQAVLHGHVRATFGPMTLTSNTATVFEREKKAVFRGAVRISRPGQVLQADIVTYFYEENRLLAEGQTRVIIQETP